jgi:hypothetical protein
MNLPKELRPTANERIKLPMRWFVKIPKVNPVFKPWTGKKVRDTYGRKAILNFYGKPQFAELGILKMMVRSGWSGVWVDTYRNKFRTRYWPKDAVELPAKQANILNRIREEVGSRAGCFDVFCWKGDRFIFIESKRCHKDTIRDTQKKWLQIAHLKCGIPFNRFLIVEWSVPEQSG